MYARTENEYQVFLLAGTLQSVLLKRKAFLGGGKWCFLLLVPFMVQSQNLKD